jgi:hypothetical protein
MSKKGSDCRIEPEFRSHKRKHAKPVKTVEQEYSDSEDESPSVATKEGGFMSTLKEHKFTIMIFAVIIVLLICVVVWLVTKNDKQVRVEGVGPPTNATLPKAPAATTPPSAANTVTPNTPTTPATDTTSPPAASPNTDTAQPAAEPEPEPDKVQSHKEIVMTVDDSELNKYMDVDIESN